MSETEETTNPGESAPQTDHGEVTALKADETMLTELQDQVKAKDSRILELEAQLNSVNGLRAEMETLKQTQEKSSSEVNGLKQALHSSLDKYRTLVISQNPDIPEEMIQGTTLEELEASLTRAKILVEKVREKVKAEAAQTAVPAGAPPRKGIDIESLSPIDKIKYGLRR